MNRSQELYQALQDGLVKTIYGQEAVIRQILAGMFAGGHLLLEGVPGTGKTLLVRGLSRLLDYEFRRIQFTPDLMPADITGTNVYNTREGNFSFRRGPVFTNLLLADEINRTPPKVQSALLEAMEERQVTVDGDKSSLPEPFAVLPPRTR